MKEILRRTRTICPVCLRRVNGIITTEDERLYLERSCKEHGKFKALIWNNSTHYKLWLKKKKNRPNVKKWNIAEYRGCPYDCGVCENHRQETCHIILEVTQRCDLLCPVCFADSRDNSA